MQTLQEGTRRTPHKKQELIRITLRRYLPRVIEEEAASQHKRLTNIEPWPKGTLEKCWAVTDKEGWDKIESAMAKHQPPPHFDD